jgi:hypothetical protein
MHTHIYIPIIVLYYALLLLYIYIPTYNRYVYGYFLHIVAPNNEPGNCEETETDILH